MQQDRPHRSSGRVVVAGSAASDIAFLLERLGESPMSEQHIMASLPNGRWTCTCGEVASSTDQRDLFIHEVWAVRQERDAAELELGNLRERLDAATGLIQSIADGAPPQEGDFKLQGDHGEDARYVYPARMRWIRDACRAFLASPESADQ